MDKNFVNIDDLVRQRLVGGEEPERAGAWLQMRDLLDKEMPRKRGGFIYWRNIFSAIGVLALISTMSIGSYMYATSTKGNTTNNTTTNNNDLITNASPTPANPNEVNNKGQIASVDATRHTNDNEPPNKQTNENKTVTLKQTNNYVLASNQNTTHHKTDRKNKNQETIKNRQFLAQLIAANERSKQLATNDRPSAISGINTIRISGTAATHIANLQPEKEQNVLNHDNTTGITGKSPGKHVGKHVNDSKKDVNKEQGAYNNTLLALNLKPTASNTKPTAPNTLHPITGNNAPKAAANKNGTVNMSKLALSSNISTTKKITSAGTAKIINGSNKLKADNSNKTAVANSTDKKPAGNSIIKKEVAAVKMGKKVIDRLVMTEHYVKTSPTEGYFKLDTISIESVSEELGVNNDQGSNPANSGARKIAGTTTGSNNSIGSNNTSENNETAQANANSPILPAATTSATGKSGMGIKENQVSKTGSGTSTVEKLSATFNDIKFHIAGAQFAPGLTAGINGTFFGPNSFKGFQFGFTGSFIFGDNLSILAELKYFHRINNNYSLNDNYYTYTPTGGGMYSKELQPVSYNFSTLHSIEMPISIRYCLSHFNFFVGGNLVYSFAINTGASTLATTTPPPTLVSTPGNDNEPKIKADDFDSRFGLGYLLGISYQVSPNVMLDFRNVQTVWNNASTQGAKIISNQLYKSPSLQVSIGYRLGGNKKNKDQ